MLRAIVLAGAVLFAACAGGCTANETRDLQFQLRKAEQDRDALQQRLKDEQARSVALQARFDAEEKKWNADRALVSRLTERTDQLTKASEELTRQFEALKERPVSRPTVSGSPLPPETDESLQALATKYSDRVWYERSRGAVSFASDRFFDAGSDVVRPEAQPALTDLAAALGKVPASDYEIIVVGHTDDAAITRPETLAKHPSNWHLSVHRAISVKDVLVKAGLPPAQLGVMGYAEFRPAGSDAARNRRVEVFVVRRGEVQPLAPVQRPKQ